MKKGIYIGDKNKNINIRVVDEGLAIHLVNGKYAINIALMDEQSGIIIGGKEVYLNLYSDSGSELSLIGNNKIFTY